MSRFDWLSELLARFLDEHILVRRGSADALPPAHLLILDPEDWGRAAGQAAAFDCRWAGVWADEQGDQLVVTAALEREGDLLLLRTEVPAATPLLPSHTPHFPAADRMERHAQDLLGVAFTDHPDPRRWTRHAAWHDSFPLRRDAPPPEGGPAPADSDYPFAAVHGVAVHEVPVGPVHAGIIEPGHFRFHVVGEQVLNLEARLGYVHRGVEKLAVGRDAAGLARLAGRIAGDSTVAHTWAACQALERATGTAVPPRGLALRALLAERERIANHLGDIGAICNDVGFAFAQYQFSRLRELWQRDSAHAFGHRLLMDRVVPGGVAVDLDATAVAALAAAIPRLRAELSDLLPIVDDHPSLEDRLAGTGRLAPETARRIGVGGIVGRASGQARDLRRDNPYPPYERLNVTVPVAEAGDVAARVRLRAEELQVSLGLIEQLLSELPEGAVATPWAAPASACEGIGMVEGWRGDVFAYVRLDEHGRIARFFPRDPSWFAWPALEQLIEGNIIADFPVCNKSVNGAYAGCDL